MNLPPLNLSASTTSGADQGGSRFDNAGFVVNYGGGGVPVWLLIAAGVGVAWLLLKKG